MAYKKYIKKNGKIYGPYIYHSKRVDGKVVSEYRGLKEATIKKVNKKSFFFIFAAIFLVLFFSLFFALKSNNISGNVILNLDSQYQEDQPLEGVLSIGLKQGEMIPDSSKVVFENAGNSYEYNLSDLVEEELVEGEFFAEGQSSLGQGSGYGLIGKKLYYPDVYFKLEIIEEENSSESLVEEIIEKDTNITEENITTNITEEIQEPEVQTSSESLVEEIIEKDTNITEENITTNITEEIQEPEVQTTPITGNAIGGFFSSIFRNPTGRVVSESEGQLQAEVSYWGEFRHTLKQGQDVKIVPGSIGTETKKLSEENLQIVKQDNEIIITTDYYEETSGFGEEYLGEEKKNLEINISSLGLNFRDSNLKIKLIYEDKEFRSFEIDLGESFTNISEEAEAEDSEFSLTENEKSVLDNEFGEESVKQTARAYKDWIIVNFNLGDYEVEYSYNKDLSREELDFLIEKDKLNWLKDISKELTTEETPSFKLDEFNKNYDIS